MRSDLPSGTVTFLFTDVEGSTRLLHELGSERYADALAEHRRVVREACSREGGVEVDTQGDAFFFAFPTARGAVRAADEVVDGLAPGPIRLRIGVHTGTPLVTDEGYVGPDVVRAARIAASGHGGQIIVSAQAVDHFDVSAAPVSLRDLGEHRFKDLLAPERVFQLGGGDFPPLRSLYRTNLPVPPTAFVGRENELAELVGLLRDADLKLLTLTGPGGTGKTRLAVQAAVESSESFPDGLWWVALASLRDSHLLAPSLAQALSVEEEPGREVAETVADWLRGKQALLLVDNAEHLLPGVATELAWLCDIEGPTVLVTSRERLQLQGERVYSVPSLDEMDGVELFVDRARALGCDVHASPAVAELCARLDNLPLALELAAARTIVFSPEQLLERLSEPLDMLKAGRDADPRQQTLRATIQWSYDLLDDRERRLFRGLSVFPGCTFEAAEAVCESDPDTLQALLDQSLLRRTADERSRYRMLATIREFADEQLRAEQEDGVVRDRHADYYLALARSANLAAEDMGPQRHELVIPERDNLRAALGWALESDARELGLELVVALENYWATSSPHEGAEWAALLLDSSGEAPAQLVSRALRVLGGMQNQMGRPELAEGSWQRAIDLARASGDERGVAILLHRLAHVAIQRGDLKAVRALAEESLAGHRRSGFPKGAAQALTSLADVARAEGAYDDALELLAEARKICEEIGFRWWLSGVVANIAVVSLELGRLEDARSSALEALALSQAMQDRKGIVYEFALLAEIAATTGDLRDAGTLWGAVEAEQTRAPAGRWIHGPVEPERVLAYADDEFEVGRASGQELELDEAIAMALEWPTGGGLAR